MAKQSRLQVKSLPGSRKAWSISTRIASNRKEGLIGADGKIDVEDIREITKKGPLSNKLNTTISIITKEILAETATIRVSRTRTIISTTKESRTIIAIREEVLNHLKTNTTTMASSNKCAINPKELIIMGIEGCKIARLTFTTSTSNITRIRVTRICISNETCSTSKIVTIAITMTEVTDRAIMGTNNKGNGTTTLLLMANTPIKMPIMTSREQLRTIEA